MQVGNILPEKINSTKKRKKSASAGFSPIGGNEQTHESEKVDIGRVNVSSLWTLQTLDDEFGERESFFESSEKIIDELKDLRLCLLNGELTKQNIQNLSTVLDNSQISFKDREMQKLLDDVRLRAAIELAKLEKANN